MADNPIAVNPKTGQKVQWNGQGWMPLDSAPTAPGMPDPNAQAQAQLSANVKPMGVADLAKKSSYLPPDPNQQPLGVGLGPPLAGPLVSAIVGGGQTTQQAIQQGKPVKDALEQGAGTAAMSYGGAKLIGGVFDYISKAGAASKIFQSLDSTIGKEPVDVTAPGAVGDKIMTLGQRGGTIPKVVRNFMQRVTDPDQGPMTYSEARDFYSNATKLSADEFKRLNDVQKFWIGKFTHDLGASIAQTADRNGMLPDYATAMQGAINKGSMSRAGGTAASYTGKTIGRAVGDAAAVGAGYTVLKQLGLIR